MRRLAILACVTVPLLAPISGVAQETAAERADRGTITAFLEDNLSGAGRQVIIRDFQGALSSRATASQMTIADDQGVWLTLNDIVLDWNRSALLVGEVSVNELTVGEVILARNPGGDLAAPAPEAGGFALPELPVSVRVAKIAAARVVVGQPVIGQAFEGTVEAALQLAGGDGEAKLKVQRNDDGPSADIALDARYTAADRTLSLDLSAVEEAGGIAATLLNLPGTPSVDLRIIGAGPVDDFAAEMTLKSAGQDRLAGRVTLRGQEDGAQRFAVDFNGDVAPLFLPQYADFFGPEIALSAEGQRDPSGRIDLSALDLSTRAVRLTGQVSVAADGLPEQFSLTGDLGDPEGSAVLIPGSDGTVSLQSATIDIGYDSRQGETWRATMAGLGLVTAGADIGGIALSGSGRISRVKGDALVGGTLTSRLTGVLARDPALAEALGPEVAFDTRFWWTSSSGELRLGGLSLTAGDVALAGSGSIADPTKGVVVTGTATLTAGSMGRFSGLAGRPLSGSGAISLAGRGSLLGGDFDAKMQVEGQDLTISLAEMDGLLRGAARLSLDAKRDEAGMLIRDFSVTSPAIDVQGRGQITSTSANLALDFAVPNLGVLGPTYGGGAQGSARIEGPLLQNKARIEADFTGQNLAIGQPELDRLLRGTAALSVKADLDGEALLIEAITLAAPQVSARVAGMLALAGSDLVARIDLADLGQVMPAYGGRIGADVTVKGTPDSAVATMAADTRDLRVGQDQADRLLAGDSRLETTLRLDQGQVLIDTLTVKNAQVDLSAAGRVDPVAQDVDLSARIDLVNLGQVMPGFGGRIGADLTVAGTPQAARATITADANGLRIGQAEADRLLAGASRLVAAVRLDQGQLRIDDLTLTNPQVDVSAKGRMAEGGTNVDLTARLSNLGLLLADFPGPVTLQGTAAEDASGYVLNLAGSGPGQINGRINGRVGSNFRALDLTVEGTAQAGLANPFIGPRVVSGPISLALRVNGPPALSSVSGRVSLNNGRLADPSLPFTVQDLSSTVDLAGGQARVAAQATISTGGNLSVDGSIGLSPPFPSDLNVLLTSVVVRDPQLYETRANGTLSITGPLTGGALISGRIALPETELRISATGLGASGDLPGLTHVNEPAAVRETRRRAGLLGDGPGASAAQGRPFALDIVISAPNRLFLRGRGLDAELGGELRITGTSAAVVPTGAFNLIRGRLDILGRRLVLTEAQLQLQGDFDPLLSIAASTNSDGITSSVRIDGSATDPKVSFTSSPELPEEEVLAQLLFGRRLETLSAFQALQLANAVATLAGRGGDGVVNRLRQGFALDDLDVETNAEGETQVTAGKYLTEKIYSEVVVDQSGKSQINLNLDLTDNLTVKGGVGADGNTGIGLFFEKDY